MSERKGGDDAAWSIAEAESRILGELRGWIRTNQERVTRETARLRTMVLTVSAATVIVTMVAAYVSYARARDGIEKTRSDLVRESQQAEKRLADAAGAASEAIRKDVELVKRIAGESETRQQRVDELLGRLEKSRSEIDAIAERAKDLEHALRESLDSAPKPYPRARGDAPYGSQGKSDSTQ